MKITSLETIRVNVPVKSHMTAKTSHGEHATSPYLIVRLHTDEGLVGLGEGTISPGWSGETVPGAAAIIEDLVAPVITGHDPTQINMLRQKLDKCIRLNPFAKAAVEMALWDLKGKSLGVPVYQLLGGKVRDVVPIKLVVWALEVPKAEALAQQFLDWGAKCLKIKVGLDPDADVERVRAIRKLAGPDIPIGVDANCGWSPNAARQTLRRLEEFDLLFAEQPIPTTHVEALAELRSHTVTPIMADESVFTLEDAWNITAHRAADILSCYPGKHGGIATTMEIANVARSAGIVCSIGSNMELGIGTAAMLHVAAACPTIKSEIYPADILGPLYHETDLLTEPLQLGPPVAYVPEGPGLGVELDEDKVEQYRDHSTTAKQLA